MVSRASEVGAVSGCVRSLARWMKRKGCVENFLKTFCLILKLALASNETEIEIGFWVGT